VSPADGYGYASEDAFSQASRDQLIGEAKNSVDAGTDYDPETETPVAYLYYDDQIGEIFADVEIKPLEDEDQ